MSDSYLLYEFAREYKDALELTRVISVLVPFAGAAGFFTYTLIESIGKRRWLKLTVVSAPVLAWVAYAWSYAL